MKYFNVAELVFSQTAKSKGIDNTPPLQIKVKLSNLINNCLDNIREACGFSITVTSGYRCSKLNAAVGGKPTSQHTKGEAVDLVGKNDAETRLIFTKAKELGNFDQLLFESNGKNKWVHLSWKAEGNRHQAIDNYKA